MNVLVVGAGGYIGSHMCKMLVRHRHTVAALDNFSTGFRQAARFGELIEGGVGDPRVLDRIFEARRFDAVMHFAGLIQVGESVRDPARYYRSNVADTQNLLDAMLRHGVKRFVFSSTAAIFGDPQQVPISESAPAAPINPYGRSKWMVEQILSDYERAYGFEAVCLRYFNAAGADPDGELGERHDPETHLIPLVLQAASGRRAAISVYGMDYDTPDGTCIRDYIHVDDLCAAHLLALQRLANGAGGGRYNLGNGNGFSVNQVIETAGRVTGRAIPVHQEPRRPGDPARLVADSRLARDVLGWTPQYPGLEKIVADAWAWEQKYPW